MTISIETENAGTYPDVDEAQVIDLSERLADGMVFLTVFDSSRPEEMAQAAHSAEAKGKYVIEYKTDDGHQYQATVPSAEDVGRFLASWAWPRDGWREGHAWKELHL